MVKIIFATNNIHKLREIRSLVSDNINIFSLKDAGIITEIPEDYETLEENALQKARFIFDRTGTDCFADDTGLEVEALNGEPGVYSARYSLMGDLQFPEMEISEGNIHKLLLKLRNTKNRKARFRTVISLILNNQEFKFEGVAEGSILRGPRGKSGFGYDPIFLPEGSELSFAEMSLLEKNRLSHRGKAVENLVNFLNQHG
ncbi:MAG: RdgB/HAM1 family non-canonical purine NTP pyrophosphatase [Bacteroidota bacterium]